jgi:hypothetical protein
MIDSTTADQLDALADRLKAATGPSADLDTQMRTLIAEPMLTIQGRTLASARYTLNITNALQARAKQWYMKSLMEIGYPGQPYASCWFDYVPQLGEVRGGAGATGATIGLATCAAICTVWSTIIRRWLAGNYPSPTA